MGLREDVSIPRGARQVLRGRRKERDALDGLLEGARTGRSGSLVLTGEAGVGKTALLEYAADSAAGMKVLRAAGIESEMELGFAALHQLCAPVLDHLDRLPRPQRDALATTFGLGEGTAPDRFLVGLAVLSLLSDVAEKRPVVCVVDDAQWLDRASAQTLAFVARRLFAESVVMLFATRETDEAFRGLPGLVVGGLPDDEARQLLVSAMRGPVDAKVLDQIVAEARGNPLALLELPSGLTSAELAGGFRVPASRSLSSRIEESFRQRFDELPEEIRRLLLVAAADPTGDPALFWRAAKRLGIGRQALEPMETAGLLEVTKRVTFRHPLVRSAVYEMASPEQRRATHHALGEATDADLDPDRRAWHLAAATSGPDEDVAAELERAAGRAQARGGLAAAAAFRARAAELTADSARRSVRALAAAQTEYEAGSLDTALALLDTADRLSTDDLDHARRALLRAEIAFASRRGAEAPSLLLKAARELEGVDPELARETYLEAMSAAMFAGRLARGGGAVEVSKAALAAPLPLAPARPPDLLLRGLAIHFTEGYTSGAPLLKEALRAFQREPVLPPHESRWLWFASWVALHLWDDKSWTVLSTRQLDLVREAGALTALPFVLTNRSSVFAFMGELATAASLEEELQAATDATGIAVVPYGAISLAGLRGREAEVSELIRTTVREAGARGEGLALTATEFLSGVLYNGLGRYGTALEVVSQAEPYYEFPVIWSLPERIEAAVRSGQPRRADRAFELVVEGTRAAGTDWGLGIGARCRALLSQGDAADSLYREAIERLGRSIIRVQLARSHLLYGEWLRREHRRLDAREQLRTALAMFTTMGTQAFAARAERELLATGERVRKRVVATRKDLTPQEAQIAQLARDGHSNPEIGERLFISSRTVEYHLHKVFDKLDIESRVQLARALPPEPALALGT